MEVRARTTYRSCPECLAAYEEGYVVCARDGAALVERDDDPLVGRELERYRIESVIGSGAMGRVYRAQHMRMSRQFALKLLYGNLAADSRMRKRFAREAEAASRLSHPNLITVVDVGETASGLPYLAMDLVEGESLFDVITREAPLPTDRTVAIVRGMLRGLGHAHARGLVHRDLKPANVLLTRDETGEEVPRIVDFGLALVHESAVGRVTTASLVFGTPEYMAPEQAYGEADIDGRADLFALGIMVYEMLSGVLPFSGRSVDIMRKNVAAPVPPFAERAPHVVVNPALEAVVMKLLAKERRDRFASAGEVLEALDVAVPGGRSEPRDGRAGRTADGEAPVAPPSVTEVVPLADGESTDVETAFAPLTSRRRGLVLVAMAAIAALGLLLVLSLGRSSPSAPRAPTASRAEPALGAPPAAPTASRAEPALGAPPAAPLRAESPSPGTAPSSPGAAPRPEDVAPAPASAVAPATRRPPRERAPVAEPPQKARERSSPPAPAASAEELVARYRRLGQRLDGLARSQPEIAAPLRKRYFAIPLADALRRPELRAEVGGAIAALERQLPTD